MKPLTFVAAVLVAASAEAQEVGFPLPGPTPSYAPLAPLAPPDHPPLDVSTGESLELSEVHQSVEASFPLLLAQQARVQAARGAALSADGAFDLQLGASGQTQQGGYAWNRANVSLTQPTPLYGASVTAGYRIGLGEIQSYYDHETLDAGEVRAQLRVPLLRDGTIDANRAGVTRAEQSLLVVDAEARELALRTLRDATGAYVRWVAAGRRYVVARDLAQLADSRDAQIAGLVSAGAVPAIEQLENRRAIFTRRRDLADAQRALEQAGIQLSLYLRDRAQRPVLPPHARLPAELAAPTDIDVDVGHTREHEQRALANRPEIARASALIERARVTRELADNQLLPRLDLALSISHDLGNGENQRLRDPLFDALLTLVFPLQQREARGRLQTAQAEVDEAAQRLRFARDQVVADVRDAESALRAARERLTAALEAARIAAEVAAAERARFGLGASTLLMVNLREQAAADAETARIDAVATLHLAYAQWLAAMGESPATDAARR